MTSLITKEDLWMALFSLDSYHRDYGVQVTTIARSGTHLGNAVIIPRLATPDWQSAGFYAIAYDVSSVTGITGSSTVIAYRGTDVKFLDSATMGGSDAINGYSIALGGTQSRQAVLAARFYRIPGTPNYEDTILNSFSI